MRKSNVYRGRKWKAFIFGVCVLLFLCFAIFATQGCEENTLEWLADDSSYEARIEETRIALDDRNYERARSLLLELRAQYPGDPLVLQYLSNAYAGLAGLDTFNLLETIDQLIGANETGSIDAVGLVLGDVTGAIARADINNIMTNLENAIDVLEEIPNPTDDQTVQFGLLSLNHAAWTIADIVTEETGLDEVELTEDGLAELYPTTPDFSEEATPERLTSLSEDIGRIDESVDTIASITGADTENDLSESFDEFQSDIDANADELITQQELQDYISSL